MVRRLLVLVAAVVLAVGGQLLLWSAGTALSQILTSPFSNGEGALLAILAILGAALLGASIATVGFSSIGALVVGTAAVILGVLGMLLPTTVLLDVLPRVDRTLDTGALVSVATGPWLIGGSIFVAVALAARAARREPSTILRVVVVAIALAAGLGGTALGALGSDRILNRSIRLLESADLLGIVLVYFAAVLLSIAVSTTRWSAAGGVVLGGFLLAFGIAAALLPQAVGVLAAAPDLRFAIATQAFSGSIAALGAIVLAGALAVRVRRKRGHPDAVAGVD